MNRTWAILAISAVALAVLAGLSLPDTSHPLPPADKVNLALRRTAHKLLAQSGDSTSTIQPVEQVIPGIWTIRLERPFNYRALADILQESFQRHNITANYDVALLDCTDNVLLLGYNKLDLTEQDDPPCGTRDQTGQCYVLKVEFAMPPRYNGRWWWLGALALLPGLYYLTRRFRRPLPAVAAPAAPAAEAAPDSAVVIGRSLFDPANQTLTVAGERRQLTYREAKLLQLFSQHPNQLLERDFILQSVWADEGILVGRSVDMFVSRLRKHLRADDSIRLVNVHGVGYRMEVA